MIIMSFVEMMVGTAQNIINYLLLLLYIVNCSKFIWFFDLIWFDLIWFDLVITTLLLKMVLHWHCVHQFMCVVVIFDLLVATSGINPRVPGFESHFTGSPILTVKARTFDFSDSFKLFHDDIDNKSESQGWFCLFVFFLTSSQLSRFFCLVSFIGAVMLNACCGFGGFLFFKRWVLEPLSPSRWFWFYMTLLWQGCHSNDIQK